MGKYSGRFSRTYWGGYDLSGQTNTMQVQNGAMLPEVSTQGAIQKSYVVGLGEGSCEQHGFLTDVANEAHDRLSDNIGGSEVFAASFGTHPGAAAAMGSSVCLNAYDSSTPVDGASEFTARYMNADDGAGIEFGWLLATLGQRATAAPSWDRGAGNASNNGLRAYLIQTANGGPATISVEGSTDDAAWSGLGTFTATSGRHGTAIAVAGTVHRYLRATTDGTATFAIFVRPL